MGVNPGRYKERGSWRFSQTREDPKQTFRGWDHWLAKHYDQKSWLAEKKRPFSLHGKTFFCLSKNYCLQKKWDSEKNIYRTSLAQKSRISNGSTQINRRLSATFNCGLKMKVHPKNRLAPCLSVGLVAKHLW